MAAGASLRLDEDEALSMDYFRSSGDVVVPASPAAAAAIFSKMPKLEVSGIQYEEDSGLEGSVWSPMPGGVSGSYPLNRCISRLVSPF